MSVSRNSRILLVDDQRSIRGILHRWLADAGFDCIEASCVREAVEAVSTSVVDAVITDIEMPQQSGFELLADLQLRNRDLPVLVLTGSGNPRLATEAIKNGACGYLVKPVKSPELVYEIRRVLDRRRLMNAAMHYTASLEQRVAEHARTLRIAQEELIHRLVMASMVRDDETGSHIKRIGLFSAVVAAAAQWPSELVDDIRLAAPMHDIGKIGIPDAILCKPGKLTPEEFEVMKTHTVIGANILRDSQTPMLRLAETIARSHHERWDGSGYPDGLAGKDIPEGARIVAIVDVYDALTHDRVYRPALPEAEALELIERGRGSHFDPELLDQFLSVLPEIRELSKCEESYDEMPLPACV